MKISLKLKDVPTKPKDLVGRIYRYNDQSTIIWKYTYADEEVVRYVYLNSDTMEEMTGGEIEDRTTVTDLKAILQGKYTEIK
jgi:hypothetical protein